MAHRLLELDALERTLSEDPPTGFIADAFETYLQALTTEGHRYYLSPGEILAIAEAVHANVVVTRLVSQGPEASSHYEVINSHCGEPGKEVAVIVMHGTTQGHFERLVNVVATEEPEGRAIQTAGIQPKPDSSFF